MSFMPSQPSTGHPRKPLTKAQLRKMQQQFARSSKIIEQIKAKEASEKGDENKSAQNGVDEIEGWL